MAGPFTHFVICDVAKTKRAVLGSELWRLLNRYSQFLFLGGASPDLPYLSFKTGKVNWADVMHYEKTNGIAASGFDELKKAWSSRTAADETRLVWLLGYVSHLVADATIHPIVQAIVGPYEQNKEEHRLCEMTEDPLIFAARKNTDMTYAEFSSILKFCRESADFDPLMEFWTEQVLFNYQDKGEEPDPALWFTTYTEAIDAAEGGSDIVGLFRHLGIGNSYIYKPKDEILSKYPQYGEKYFQKVKLPNGNIGSFQKDGFDKAVDNVTAAWNALYSGLSGSTAMVVADVIKNWNLDTGVDMDSPGKEVTYWA
jgi:hypothetical protein